MNPQDLVIGKQYINRLGSAHITYIGNQLVETSYGKNQYIHKFENGTKDVRLYSDYEVTQYLDSVEEYKPHNYVSIEPLIETEVRCKSTKDTFLITFASRGEVLLHPSKCRDPNKAPIVVSYTYLLNNYERSLIPTNVQPVLGVKVNGCV